jgi:IPTL-CTERM motif
VKRKLGAVFLILSALFMVPSISNATTATIIGDSNGGICGTTVYTRVNTNLTTILNGLGYTVTSVDLNSASFPTITGVTQVWDIRCTTALSSGNETDYQAYLAAGGSLFLLGENSTIAAARNNSIASFVTTLGGGTTTFSGTAASNTQTVLSPFTGPISISSVIYAAVGNFTGYGTGSPISQNGSEVGAVYWGPSMLSTVPVGTLISVLDVNPLLDSTLQSDFISNIASYLASPNPTSYTIGGSVSGLASGQSVVLQNNGGDNNTANANGAFTFATSINSGSAYAVTVLTQPTGQTCTVSNGSGTATANVTNVSVTCTNNPPPVNPIPTLSEWAQIMMMLAMIATAGLYGWRMKQR